MGKLFVTGFMALTLFGPARADEPFDFKGIKLGSSEQQIKTAINGIDCYKPVKVVDRICSTSKESFAGIPNVYLTAQLVDDQVNSINVSFPTSEFSAALSALNEKYGTSSDIKKETITTRVGVSYENEIYTWSKGGSTLVAKRYSYRVDRSSVEYMLDDYLEKLKKRMSLDSKINAKDL